MLTMPDCLVKHPFPFRLYTSGDSVSCFCLFLEVSNPLCGTGLCGGICQERSRAS